MRGHFETKGDLTRETNGNSPQPTESNLLESISYNARAAAAGSQQEGISGIQSQYDGHRMVPQGLSEQQRRTSLGLFGTDWSFDMPNRPSLSFGSDFVCPPEQQQQHLYSEAYTSHLGTINSSGLEPTPNAYSMHDGVDLTPNNALIHHHQQQTKELTDQQSSISRRVQTEAQRVAAALFLGAPLPGSGDESDGAPDKEADKNVTFQGNDQNFAGAMPNPNAQPNTPTNLLEQMRIANSNFNINIPFSINAQLSMYTPQTQQQSHPIQGTQVHSYMQQQMQQQLQSGRSSSFVGIPIQSGQQQQMPRQVQQVSTASLTERARLQHRRMEELNRSRTGSGYVQSTLGQQYHQARPSGLPVLKSTKELKPKKTKGYNEIDTIPSPTAGCGKKDVSFPQKLHEILSNPEYEDMICWLPHGRAWKIVKPSALENIVIPLHFRHSKYASFMRQVNGWGFERVLHGNDQNSYRHELFVRDQPELCKKMKRIGTVKRVSKSPQKEHAINEYNDESGTPEANFSPRSGTRLTGTTTEESYSLRPFISGGENISQMPAVSLTAGTRDFSGGSINTGHLSENSMPGLHHQLGVPQQQGQQHDFSRATGQHRSLIAQTSDGMINTGKISAQQLGAMTLQQRLIAIADNSDGTQVPESGATSVENTHLPYQGNSSS